MSWAATGTRGMSYTSEREANFLLNHQLFPQVRFRPNPNAIPVTRAEFALSLLDIQHYPRLYVPSRVRSYDFLDFSLGEAITRRRFPYLHTEQAHDYPHFVGQFIGLNPALFVPGSYHTDMSSLGMPPLTDDHERYILSQRGANEALARANASAAGARYRNQERDILAAEAAARANALHERYILSQRGATEALALANALAVGAQNSMAGISIPVPAARPIRAPRPSSVVRSRFLDAQPSGQQGVLIADLPAVGRQDNNPVPAPHPLDYRPIGSDCPICFEPLQADGSTLLPCGHRHHASCLFRMFPQRCPDCRATTFPTQGVLNNAVYAEVALLRNQVEETTVERDSLRVELAEIQKLYDLEREKLKLLDASSTQEIKTLKERIKTISFAVEASLSSAVKCASDIASMACELVKENNTLRAESRPGFLLRRVTDQRNGFAKLVESMGRVNGNMSKKINALELKLKRC